jgi:hypothetical protein
LEGSPRGRFGLLELATRHGLGEAARLPSILPPPQPGARHEDDGAHEPEQEEIDSENHQDPDQGLSHCPHLPPSVPVLTAKRIPGAVRSDHGFDPYNLTSRALDWRRRPGRRQPGEQPSQA